MTNFHEEAIMEVLRSELGKTANIWLYGREHRTPMTFVLDEVERQIGPRFSIYWVDGGSPEVFTLPGFSPSPVVFSTRYLSLSTVMRQLLVNDALENILVQVAERAALKAMAEMALRHGDPEYAVLAFVKSITVSGIWLIDGDDDSHVMELEHAPIEETYMATWFYGLVHELGHLSPIQMEPIPDSHLFSDTQILDMITVALDDFRYTDSIKHEAIERAKQQWSNSVLRIDHIRSEGLADMFAASILFKTTVDIMREINREKFKVVQFIGEMVIFLNLIAIVDRCRRVASIASVTTTSPEVLFESLLHPISVLVRAMMLRVYLEHAVACYLFDVNDPTPEQSQQVEKLINEINEHYEQRINLLDSGIARAMEFSLFPERRENDWALLEVFRKKLLDSSGAGALVEAQRFCKLADILEVDSKLLKALKGIVDRPSQPISPDPMGDLIYFVPWVEGPNGFNRPFGLDTKHGHLVFVFHDQGELYTIFFEESIEELKSGFTLKHSIIPVPRKERLGPELAAHMLEGQSFQIIVEGTKAFEQYMKELADGTIWED